jgi:hypothetical protein
VVVVWALSFELAAAAATATTATAAATIPAVMPPAAAAVAPAAPAPPAPPAPAAGAAGACANTLPATNKDATKNANFFLMLLFSLNQMNFYFKVALSARTLES